MLSPPQWLSSPPHAGRHPPRSSVQLMPTRKVQEESNSSAAERGNNIQMEREWEGDGKGPRDGGSGNGNGNEREKKAIARRST